MFDQFAKLKENALKYLDEASAYAASVKQNATAEEIRSLRHQLAECRYNIAVVGNMKRGKSTLVNTLLGRCDDDVSPVQAKVCTASIVHYLSREASPSGLAEAQVFFADKEEGQRVPLEAIRGYVTEEHNPENVKRVRSIEVYGDFPLLHNAVTLVDTPGRGAIQEYHETLLEQFLPMADAIIFLISADLPIEASEQEFLNILSKNERDRIFFVLTKRDEVSNGDIREVRNYVEEKLSQAGLKVEKLHEVSAKRLFDARKAGLSDDDIAKAAEESGVNSLESELEKFIISKSDKNAALIPRIKNVLITLQAFCETNTRQVTHDIEAMEMDVKLVEDDCARLRVEGAELRKSLRGSLEKFERNWLRETSRFKAAFAAKSDVISDRIIERVARGGLISKSRATFKIGTIVARAINQEIEVQLNDLEASLSKVVSQLSDELDSHLAIYKRCRLGTEKVAVAGNLFALGLPGTAATIACAKATAAVGLWSAYASTAGQVGAAQSAWTWLVGSGGTVVTTGKAAALSAAIMGTGVGIAALGVAVIAVAVANGIVGGIHESRIPELVSASILENSDKVVEHLNTRRDEIAKRFSEAIEEQIAANELQLEKLKVAIASHDPALKAALIQQKEQLARLMNRNQDLGHSLKLLA